MCQTNLNTANKLLLHLILTIGKLSCYYINSVLTRTTNKPMIPQQIIELAQREKVTTNFAAFYKECFKTVHPTTPYHHNWHIDYLSEIAMDCSKFKIPKIIINMPPGLSKSTLFSQAYVAWCLGKDPGLYNMCVSSSDSLVVEHSNKTRDIMKSSWYQAAFPHTIINKETDHLLTTTQNGTRVGFSTLSRVTGKGAHNLIFDDFLDAEMAKSDAVRTDTVDKVGGKFFTRLRDNTEDGKKCIMVIEQRLHDMDLTGKLLGDFVLRTRRRIVRQHQARTPRAGRSWRAFHR